ncbi:MAG: nucleotidyltransferase domain-containing protein [Rhizomicrobium sp.]
MTSPAQQSLLDAITRVLSADARIESAWLSGSLGKGAGDEFSDVDVTVVAPEPSFDAVLKHHTADLSAIAPVVHRFVHGFDRVVSSVTDDWQRFDLTFLKPAEFAAMPLGEVRPLFNRGTPEKPAPAAPPPHIPQAARIEHLVREFLRILGLAPGAMGRGEYLASLEGVGMLRRMVIDLMREKNGTASVPGSAIHVNVHLTGEQRRALEALPPLGANRESLLAMNRALWRIFRPLGQELCAQTGAPWPAAFEDATRRRLAATLGLEI